MNPTDPVRVAPRWHTVLLVALIVAVAVAGALLPARAAPTSITSTRTIVTSVYLPIVAVQWALLLYVCRVGRPRRGVLRALLGAPWTSARRALADVGLAACGWILLTATEYARARWLGGSEPARVTGAMLPHGAGESIGWAVLSLSAGFCEEVVFRGYLKNQFEAATGRAWLAVMTQGVVFGLAHSDQGFMAATSVALYGVGLGALAQWRRSLAPAIVCHAWTDLASGLLRV